MIGTVEFIIFFILCLFTCRHVTSGNMSSSLHHWCIMGVWYFMVCCVQLK